MTKNHDAAISGTPNTTAALDAAFDPKEARERDLRRLMHMQRTFDGAAAVLEEDVRLLTEFHTEKITYEEAEKEAGKLGDRIKVLHKSLLSIFDVQERIARQIEDITDTSGGLDFDAARDEVRRRLARLAERIGA